MKDNDQQFNFAYEETEGDTKLHEACKTGSTGFINRHLKDNTAHIFTKNANNEMPFDCVVKYCKKIKYTFHLNERGVDRTYDPNYNEERDQSLEKPQRQSDIQAFRKLFRECLNNDGYLNKNFNTDTHLTNCENDYESLKKQCHIFEFYPELVKPDHVHLVFEGAKQNININPILEFLLERCNDALELKYLQHALDYNFRLKSIDKLIANKVGRSDREEKGLELNIKETTLEYLGSYGKYVVKEYIGKGFFKTNIISQEDSIFIADNDVHNLGGTNEDSSEE